MQPASRRLHISCHSVTCFAWLGTLPTCRPPIPEADNQKLVTVHTPRPYAPVCLELAAATRVCTVRVDVVEHVRELVRQGSGGLWGGGCVVVVWWWCVTGA